MSAESEPTPEPATSGADPSVQVVFVLVETARAVNLGAAARALKTMGFSDLRLVACTARPEDPHARAVAHASTEILDRATTHPTLTDALADCDLAIATTGRRRGNVHEVVAPSQLAEFVAQRALRVAVVFGSEESGLSNEHVGSCQVVSAIPMRSAHPSLNLAQAVMVYAYELSPLAMTHARRSRPAQSTASLAALAERIERVLPRLGIDPGRALYSRMRERALLAPPEDTNLLHSLLEVIEKRLDGSPDRTLR